MTIHNILSQLSKVRRTGDNQWIACCPAHEDRSPSLSIKNTDKKILLRCFAGCEAESIAGSIGFSLRDLFHDELSEEELRNRRNTHRQADIEHEKLVLAIANADRKRGKRLPQADLDRERRAYEIVNGRRV